MSFSSFPLTDEQIQCGICLDAFTDPVTVSCGHNFCKVCIEACWNNGHIYVCPLCKKEFEAKPELNINTELQHMKMQENNPSNILCDFCCENKLRAVKTCLQCVASFCETHLENHKTTPRHAKHKLISPVENLEDYICDNHEKPLEMFCRDDKSFLCLFCTETQHKTHDTVSIEEESSRTRIQLEKKHIDIKTMFKERHEKIKQIKDIANINKKNSEREKTRSVELFTTLMRFIWRCQSELLVLLDEKQKAAIDEAEGLIKELEQEITELKRRDTELEHLLRTDDHLHLLQTYSSVCRPLQVKSWTNISINADLNTENLEKTITRLQEEIPMELKKFSETTQPLVIQGFDRLQTSWSSASAFGNIIEPNSAKNTFVFSCTNTVLKHPFETSVPSCSTEMKKDESVPTQQGNQTDFSKTSGFLKEGKIYFTLGKTDKSTHSQKKAIKMKLVNFPSFGVDLSTIQKLYAVDVILDPNTAYPKLLLSKDGKQVSYQGTWTDVPNNPERFDCSAFVLGTDGFSCGRFYFEVQVGDQSEWVIGVARESINKKGKITVSRENGIWSISLRNGHEYMANGTWPLFLKDKIQKVGVFVDYDEGLVSFYDVESKCRIYSFISQSFTEKLYPFLSPGNKRGDANTKPLSISRFHY